MTYIFDSIEIDGDNTKVLFKKEDAVLGLGDNFTDATDEKPVLLEAVTENAVINGKRGDLTVHYGEMAVPHKEHGAALDALIVHRLDNDPQYEETKEQPPLSEDQRKLLKRGHILAAMKLDI